MIDLEKCCITSAYLQWLCHSGERAVALGPLVRLVFPCSPEINDIIPLFPITPGRASHIHIFFSSVCCAFVCVMCVEWEEREGQFL